MLAEVVRVLRPGGHLYLRGPITTHSIARRLGLALYGLAGRPIVQREPPYHLWEFTPQSLARLFRAAGLEVVGSTQSKIPPGRPHGNKGAEAMEALLQTIAAADSIGGAGAAVRSASARPDKARRAGNRGAR